MANDSTAIARPHNEVERTLPPRARGGGRDGDVTGARS